MPLNLIWLEQATHPVVLEAGDAAAEPALRSFDLAGSLGHGHAREEWWADKLVVPPLGPQTARAAPSLRWARCAVRRSSPRGAGGVPQTAVRLRPSRGRRPASHPVVRAERLRPRMRGARRVAGGSRDLGGAGDEALRGRAEEGPLGGADWPDR